MKDNVDALLKKHANLIAPYRPTCTIGTSKRRTLIEALFARDLQATAVYRIMKAEGETANYPAFQRHRRGSCECER